MDTPQGISQKLFDKIQCISKPLPAPEPAVGSVHPSVANVSGILSQSLFDKIQSISEPLPAPEPAVGSVHPSVATVSSGNLENKGNLKGTKYCRGCHRTISVNNFAKHGKPETPFYKFCLDEVRLAELTSTWHVKKDERAVHVKNPNWRSAFFSSKIAFLEDFDKKIKLIEDERDTLDAKLKAIPIEVIPPLRKRANDFARKVASGLLGDMSEATAAAEAKLLAEAKAAAEAKLLAEAKAAAKAKRLAEATAAAKDKRLAEISRDSENDDNLFEIFKRESEEADKLKRKNELEMVPGMYQTPSLPLPLSASGPPPPPPVPPVSLAQLAFNRSKNALKIISKNVKQDNCKFASSKQDMSLREPIISVSKSTKRKRDAELIKPMEEVEEVEEFKRLLTIANEAINLFPKPLVETSSQKKNSGTNSSVERLKTDTPQGISSGISQRQRLLNMTQTISKPLPAPEPAVGSVHPSVATASSGISQSLFDKIQSISEPLPAPEPAVGSVHTSDANVSGILSQSLFNMIKTISEPLPDPEPAVGSVHPSDANVSGILSQSLLNLIKTISEPLPDPEPAVGSVHPSVATVSSPLPKKMSTLESRIEELFNLDNPKDSTKLRIELLRFLSLVSQASPNTLSPSPIIDTAWHTLLLDPVLYYDVCEDIRKHNQQTLIGRSNLIHHNPLGVHDKLELKRQRYLATLKAYRNVYFSIPPSKFWPIDYAAESSSSSSPSSSSSSSSSSPSSSSSSSKRGTKRARDEEEEEEEDNEDDKKEKEEKKKRIEKQYQQLEKLIEKSDKKDIAPTPTPSSTHRLESLLQTGQKTHSRMETVEKNASVVIKEEQETITIKLRKCDGLEIKLIAKPQCYIREVKNCLTKHLHLQLGDFLLHKDGKRLCPDGTFESLNICDGDVIDIEKCSSGC